MEIQQSVHTDNNYFDDLNRFDQKNAGVDLRLRTFQDIGRLSKLYPGAYYDHDQNGWFCRKCQAFASPTAASNPWVTGGARMGTNPTRKMIKHFTSKLHEKSIEVEGMLKKTSVHQLLQAQGMELLNNKRLKNRNVMKAMFTVALHMVKHCLPNDSFSDLLSLAGDVGASELKQ